MKSKLCFGIFFLLLFFSISKKNNAQSPDCPWAKSIGGTNLDFGYSITTDAYGNVYTTGYFQGTVDFDPGSGIFNLISAGAQDIFISKFDSSGNFIWAKSIGGTNDDKGLSIITDPAGNGSVYTTGRFMGTVDFDPDAGVFNLISAGAQDIFVSKLDSSGNFVWAKSMGGIGSDISNFIAVDPAGNGVYTTGYFYATADFDPGMGTFNLTSLAGLHDIFISKLDSLGNFVWAKAMGGTNYDEGWSIAVDPAGSGDVYTTGYFYGTADFDPDTGTYSITVAGDCDIFVSKLDSSGNFVWAKTMGGTSNEVGYSIAIDPGSGDVYTTGSFNGTADFDPGTGTFNLTGDGFISKLDSSGNFVWAKALEGTGYGYGLSIALGPIGSRYVYTTGFFTGAVDFDPGAGAFYLTAIDDDVFISKLDSSGNFVWAKAASGSGHNCGYSIAPDAFGNAYVTGQFRSSSLNFGLTTITNVDNSGLTSDIFIAKIESCAAYFTLYADTIPQNWIAVNQASGVAPLTYLWDWDDGTTSSGITPSHIYNTPGYYNICLTITDATGCTSTYCDSSTYIFRGTSNSGVITINVVLPGTTNIVEQTANESGVIVYPNPAQDLIHINSTIDFPATEIILYDASGREVMEKKFNKSASFSVKHLNTGIYFYKIKDAKGNELRGKIVKE